MDQNRTIIYYNLKTEYDPTGDDKEIETDKEVVDYTSLEPSALRNIIREAGIVGLGGAGFPSFIKLNPGASSSIDTLILNGAECEPYITADHRVMLENSAEIIEGGKILLKILGIKECYIGIENNKPDAIAAMTEAPHWLVHSQLEVDGRPAAGIASMGKVTSAPSMSTYAAGAVITNTMKPPMRAAVSP